MLASSLYVGASSLRSESFNSRSRSWPANTFSVVQAESECAEVGTYDTSEGRHGAEQGTTWRQAAMRTWWMSGWEMGTGWGKRAKSFTLCVLGICDTPCASNLPILGPDPVALVSVAVWTPFHTTQLWEGLEPFQKFCVSHSRYNGTITMQLYLG